MRLVLFDLDGTLLWTDGAGRRAIGRALEQTIGATGPIETFRFDGRTDPEIVTRLAEAAGGSGARAPVAAILDRYVELLEEELARPGRRLRVMPGVSALLQELEARADCVLGLLTGNVLEGARLKLRAVGLAPERFRVGAFGSDSADRGALPRIAQRRSLELLGLEVGGPDVVIVGDTPSDVECARGIGARVVAVATGAYSTEALRAAGADAVFDDLSDTVAVVRALLD